MNEETECAKERSFLTKNDNRLLFLYSMIATNVTDILEAEDWPSAKIENPTTTRFHVSKVKKKTLRRFYMDSEKSWKRNESFAHECLGDGGVSLK